jgi:hypothetical protein
MDVYEVKPVKDYLSGNPYVGRGIIIGCTKDNKAAIAYFIMGRSENSRNRVFLEEDNDVVINAFDESKLEDPSLIIYYPMRKLDNLLVVTNGDQTDTIARYIIEGGTFEDALMTREFEPDGPNWTPRISGEVNFEAKEGFKYKLSILKSMDADGNQCARYFFNYMSEPGLGHFIHTYITDGNPIPTFTGEPERVEINSDIDEFTNEIWDNLDEDNKISLYVRFVDVKTGETENRMINKNK